MTEQSGDEFFQGFIDDEAVVRERYETLVETYEVPVQEATRSIKLHYQSKPERFDEVANSPRRVDASDIRDIPRTVNGAEAKKIGGELQGESEYVVYFTECDVYGDGRLKDAKKEAVKFLPSVDEAPGWVYYAWKADSVYYIGQSENIAKRLKAHCCHLRKGGESAEEPSMLTGISNIKRAGIIHRCDSRSNAEEVEEAVAARWSTTDERRFVYYS